MMFRVKRIRDFLVSLLFPPVCAFCGELLAPPDKMMICEKCLAALPYAPKNACVRCGCPHNSDFALSVCNRCRTNKYVFKANFVPLIYKGAVRETLIRMKFHGDPSPYAAFANLIAQNILASGMAGEIDFVTFVPLSKSGLRMRGYNQSELIARRVAKILGVECKPSLCHRDGGQRQSTLSAAMRQENAKHSYYSQDGVTLSGCALLVDDIYTTGATCGVCAKLLMKMGCDCVYLATAAVTAK